MLAGEICPENEFLYNIAMLKFKFNEVSSNSMQYINHYHYHDCKELQKNLRLLLRATEDCINDTTQNKQLLDSNPGAPIQMSTPKKPGERTDATSDGEEIYYSTYDKTPLSSSNRKLSNIKFILTKFTSISVSAPLNPSQYSSIYDVEERMNELRGRKTPIKDLSSVPSHSATFSGLSRSGQRPDGSMTPLVDSLYLQPRSNRLSPKSVNFSATGKRSQFIHSMIKVQQKVLFSTGGTYWNEFRAVDDFSGAIRGMTRENPSDSFKQILAELNSIRSPRSR